MKEDDPDIIETAGENVEADWETEWADTEETCSFVATTLVAMGTGEQAIGTIKPGNQVWAYNQQTRKMELEVVRHLWINHDDDLVDLTLTTRTEATKGKPAHQSSETLHTNQKHPFLTVEKGFLPVAHLKLGMHVIEASGRVGVVTGWKSVPGVQTMYNLEVTQDHTYTVGTGQWVVHNSSLSGGCGDDDASKVYSAGGDPALRAQRKVVFQDMVDNGFDDDNQHWTLNQHAYNSLMKSGRKDIMPSDVIDALSNTPEPGEGSSLKYVNPVTGTKVYVNPDTQQVVGVQPSTFK